MLRLYQIFCSFSLYITESNNRSVDVVFIKMPITYLHANAPGPMHTINPPVCVFY